MQPMTSDSAEAGLPPLTGIVLAGGASRRLGRDKRRVLVGDHPLLGRVIAALAPLVRETIVVTRTGEPPAEAGADETALRFVADDGPSSGPLVGIYSGLRESGTAWSVVVACDMPFLSRPLITHLARLADDCDAVVPLIDGRPQVLHAVYAAKSADAIGQALAAGVFSPTAALARLSVRTVPQEECRRYDPELLSFFNANSEADVRRANELAAARRDNPGAA
jgi:molybdopterin-guanine dinucleotide biosynthesis protein A